MDQSEAKKFQNTREAFAAANGAEVVCGAIVKPSDPTGSLNLAFNNDEINRMAREIQAKRQAKREGR